MTDYRRLFPRVPRCARCGNPLRSVDLWLIRHAQVVSPDMKKCSRCNDRKETK